MVSCSVLGSLSLGPLDNRIIAERRERNERSEANNRILFEIPRYLYIYIYIYICLSAHALHKTVHTLRKSYHVGHCALEHRLLFGAPL